MKLSFSTNRWKNYDLNTFFEIAKEYKFNGVEIHDVMEVQGFELKTMRRQLMEYGISIPCIDMTANIADMHSNARGVLRVISTALIPPSINAFESSTASDGSLTLTTATTLLSAIFF